MSEEAISSIVWPVRKRLNTFLRFSLRESTISLTVSRVSLSSRRSSGKKSLGGEAIWSAPVKTRLKDSGSLDGRCFIA
ncbi:MAG: hypothetical protein ACXWHD_11965, partial [Candidatus Aminicenantales bacterium]